MTRFEVYKKTVTVGNDEYELRPLSGRFLGKFWSVMNNVAPMLDETQEGDVTFNIQKITEMIDEDTADKLHVLVFETLKASYPNEDEDSLDRFASRHLIEFLPHILELNLPTDNNEETSTA